MTKRTKGMAGVGMIAALAVAAFVLVPGSPEPSRAQGPGIQFQSMSPEEALTRAGELDTRVMVRFEAEWCSSCRQLDEELLSTREGAELAEDMVAVSYDFDDAANRPLIERYVVLGLPTTLVLTPDGTQVGRIMGYEGKEEWTAEFRQAREAEDPVPGLRDAHATSPDDAEATLRLGQALLVRGHPAEGEALLERVSWLADVREPAQAELAAEALFVLGRYHHRVRREPAIAQHLWRELAHRFPESEWAGGAPWWYAKAQAELDRHDLGLAALRQRVRLSPEDEGAREQVQEYLDAHGLQ